MLVLQPGAPDVGVKCAGLKNEHVDQYGNVNPLYCFERWNLYRDVWRSCQCPESSHLDAQSAILMGWRQIPGVPPSYQGSHCKCATHNARRRIPQIMESFSFPAIVSMLKNEVRNKFSTIVEMEANRSNDMAIFKQDTEVVHSMKILAMRGVNEIIFGTNIY